MLSYELALVTTLEGYGLMGHMLGDSRIEPEMNPCELSARFSVLDEDGDQLLNIELETEL